MEKLLLLSYIFGVGCATQGVEQKNIGEKQWEIRAWDGTLCRDLDNEDICKTALYPKVEAHANTVCGSEDYSIENCWFGNAVTGKRFKCKVVCN